jgi:hypothetical protein
MYYKISNEILKIILNNINLPDLPQSIILEFLDYKCYNGKYVKQLSKNMEIYELLLDRPKVIGTFLSFDINYKMRRHNELIVKTLELEFSALDRNIFNQRICYYEVDYDYSRYELDESDYII